MNARLRLLALLLPIAAVAGMIARAELVIQTGHSWRVLITGYDPRDLLSGHYLRYRLAFRMEGDATCTGGACCYCLWNAGPAPAPGVAVEPAVRVLSCAEHAPCESWFPVQKEEDLQKFFIPEGEGSNLERAIRQREAALLISVSERGRVGISDLLLDGEPWREALKHPPAQR